MVNQSLRIRLDVVKRDLIGAKLYRNFAVKWQNGNLLGSWLVVSPATGLWPFPFALLLTASSGGSLLLTARDT